MQIPVLPCNCKIAHLSGNESCVVLLQPSWGIYLAAVDVPIRDIEGHKTLTTDVDALAESLVYCRTITRLAQDFDDALHLVGGELQMRQIRLTVLSFQMRRSRSGRTD